MTQLEYWIDRASSHQARVQAMAMASARLAIGSLFDRQAERTLREQVKRLG